MAKIPNTIPFAGTLAPTDDTDIYATHISNYGRGGWHTAANITERNAIPSDRRSIGMIVVVLDSNGSGLKKEYQLLNGIENTNWVEYSGSGSSGSFDDNTPTKVAWDNIPAGTVLNGVSISEIIKMQVYPYQDPVFSSISISTFSDIKECGDMVPESNELTFQIDNQSNITLNLTLHNDSLQVVSENITASPFQFTYPSWTKTTPQTTTWKLSGLDVNNKTVSGDISMEWGLKIYYGENNLETLSNSDILSLRSKLASNYSGEYSFNSGGYKWMAIPKYLGKPASFKDTNTGFPVLMKDLGEIEVTNSFNVSAEYYLFRSVNILNGKLNVGIGNLGNSEDPSSPSPGNIHDNMFVDIFNSYL